MRRLGQWFSGGVRDQHRRHRLRPLAGMPVLQVPNQDLSGQAHHCVLSEAPPVSLVRPVISVSWLHLDTKSVPKFPSTKRRARILCSECRSISASLKPPDYWSDKMKRGQMTCVSRGLFQMSPHPE